MANVGRLNVDLVARTGQFSKGLRQASDSVGAMGSAIKRGNYTLGNFSTQASTAAVRVGETSKALGALKAQFIALTSITAVIGLFHRLKSAVTETANRLDEMVAVSDRLGGTQAQLAGLHFAAEQNNVSIETLNMALQRMTRRIAEAAVGTGEAKSALKELGLDAVALNEMSLDEKFYAVADAMNQVESASDKVRLGMKLFDSEGVKLVNVTNKGSDALREYAAEAERLGLTISEGWQAQIDVTTDAVHRNEMATQGLINSLMKQGLYFRQTWANISVSAKKGLTSFLETMAWAFTLVSPELYKATDAARELNEVIATPAPTEETIAQFGEARYSVLAERIMATRKELEGLWTFQKTMFLQQAALNGPTALRNMQNALAYWEQYAEWQKRVLDYWKGIDQELATSPLGAQISAMEDNVKRMESLKHTSGGMTQGNLAQGLGAMGQSGIIAQANRQAQRALEYAQQQLAQLQKIESNTRSNGYAVAAPG